MRKRTKAPKTQVTLTTEKVTEPLVAEPVQNRKPSLATETDDELQIRIREQHSRLGVPPSFQKINRARLQALLSDTKVSELVYNDATRNARFMHSWMLWALGEYRKITR